ncbi:metallophosphoesterase [Eubacterium ramulus]
MLFAISDIHGCYEVMEKRINLIKPLLNNPNTKLLLLGDYIDRGRKSCQCLQMAYNLE